MLQTASSHLHKRIVAHYTGVAPSIARTFGGIPLVYAAYPDGFGKPPVWRGPLSSVPPGSQTIDVRTASGTYPYIALSESEILRLAQHAHAIELHSWTPLAEQPDNARFGRILCEADPRSDLATLAEAALLLRTMLAECGLAAVPLLSGQSGVALYVPFDDAPAYARLRAWLDAFCANAVARFPRRFSTEPNTHANGRVHLHAGSNAVGRFSALPYSLRGDDALHVCAPVTWEELPELALDAFTAQNFPQRLASVGDLFATLATAIAPQRFDALEERAGITISAPISGHAKEIEPHGHVLRAALEILQDGRPRDAAQILAEAKARELLPPETKSKYVYTSLLEYIVRTSGHGHRPAIVQDIDRRFRINEPADLWPALPPISAPALSKQTQALLNRLRQTATGTDPVAFELAVCDAFAHLGFAATHVGGHQAPDGYADAQLGVLGYRVMLECKTGQSIVSNPDAVEASKYREPYGAQFCAMVGPAYGEEIEFASELQTHGVSAWTADDLQQLIRIGSNPQEMRPLFRPGFVSDALGDVLWERVHGESKRQTLVCSYAQQAVWAAQVAAAKQGRPPDAPRMTVDAVMVLIDQILAQHGSQALCTRDEVQRAFEYLTNPRVGIAVWADASGDGIVVIHPPS